jgi:energy-converting hydrogenase A subunit M
MSKDKVPNVRIKYLQCFPDLMKKMNKSKETENYFEAMNILSLLKEDLDLDVSEVIQIINIPN